MADGIVRLPLSLGPHGSVFVVFREDAAPAAERIVSVRHNNIELLGTRWSPAPKDASVNPPHGDGKTVDLVLTLPRPDPSTTKAGLQLTRNNGQITALASRPGDYELLLADGQGRKLTVAEVPTPQVLSGPWEVQFSAGWGAPEHVTFSQLQDWTQHAEAGIRHYSGTVIYRQTFSLAHAPTARMLLDLGEVRDLATVRLNGHELGTLWVAPWQLDITGAIHHGLNTLEIEIVNVWNNRLVGDAALPVEQRRTFLLTPTVHPNSPLLTAGLLGPVVVRYAVETALP